MWTATYAEQEVQPDGSLRIFVNFKCDDGRTDRKDFFCRGPQEDATWIYQQVQNYLNVLSSRDSLKQAVITGQPVSAPATTSLINDQNKDTFLSDLAQLKKFRIAISLGIKSNTDSDVVALIKKIQSEFQAGYLDLL